MWNLKLGDRAVPLIASNARNQICSILLAGWGLGGCSTSSLTSSTEMLTLLIVGVFEKSPDAAGNAEPKKITFSLTGAELVLDDGTSVDLWEGGEPASQTVISRPQIVYEKNLADYVGKSFTTLRLTFDPTVIGSGKYAEEIAVTLPDPSPDFINTLPIQKGKSIEVTANVQWKDLINRDPSTSPPTETMTPPSFRFSIGSD
jgi:hypothetical protein